MYGSDACLLSRMAFVMSAAPTSSHIRRAAVVAAAIAATCAFRTEVWVHAETLRGTPRVIDADSLIINRQRIRLKEMDAPEIRQTCRKGDEELKCGVQARDAVERWLMESDGVVTCEVDRRDRYSRLLAVCRIDGEDIGRRLVREGYAVAYRRYGKAYVADENAAKEEGRGIWSTTFDMPELWRREHRNQKMAQF